MGEARLRGTFVERKMAALNREKAKLLKGRGDIDEREAAALHAGITPFLLRMTGEEWQKRRANIIDLLKGINKGSDLERVKPIRVREDEIAWYLFLCKQALEDPMCLDVSQISRAAPFFCGIGERWQYAKHVKGIEKKIDDLLKKYKTSPDGLIFEILVALSYAEKGWEVEFLEEKPPLKSSDMVARKDGKELYVECKRQDRRGSYAETERDEFLRLWGAAKHVLVENRQWVWFKGVFHEEALRLPTDFLERIFLEALPLGNGEIMIHDSAEATIYARLIDQHAVRRHMEKYRVKSNSAAFNSVLGGDWVPRNSAVTTIHLIKTSHVEGCEAPVLGTYIDEVAWACGFTRDFDSDISIDKKARDVTKHLADAVKQLPDDKPSIIHLAAETLEGKDVERRRTEKVMATIPNFVAGKPVLGIRFHRLQSNQVIDKLFEFDETVDRFQIDGVNLDDIPESVVLPSYVERKDGSHWEIYG